MWVSVFYTAQATRKKHSTLNWVSRHWLCALVPSSWNRFHMAGLETFPVGRAPANGSFCKGSAATLGPHPWAQCAAASPGIQASVCLCPTILTTVGLSHRHAQSTHCGGCSVQLLLLHRLTGFNIFRVLHPSCFQIHLSICLICLYADIFVQLHWCVWFFLHRSWVLCRPFQADQSERSGDPSWCF